MSIRPSRATALWLAALVLSLAATLRDGAQRSRSVQDITNQRVSDLPAPGADPASPSGYAGGAHRLVLPAIDGYAWLLQTEGVLAGGGMRVRDTDADGAPNGREVHWAGPLRWWTTGLATVWRSTHPELSEPQALERVAPWANVVALLLVLVVLTPAVALWMGGVAAALFALGSVAVFPFHELFVVGYVDHHGLVTMSCALTALLLARGGGGWVRSEERAAGAGPSWVPERARAGRWFVAAGAVGAAAVWVSAATALPVLAALGLGALAATAIGRARGPDVGTMWEPGLWRLWGWAGAAACLAFYLIEYFPSRLGFRLEVNHPLYALAWAAGGDLLFRLGGGNARSAKPWIALDAALLALPAVVILATGGAAFALSDPFLARLHQGHIAEFLPLAPQLERMDAGAIGGRLSAIVLVALPLAGLLWRAAPTDSWRWARRVGASLALAVTMAFAHVVVSGLAGGRTAVALGGDALLLAGLFMPWMLPGSRARLSGPVQALLALLLIPLVVFLALSLAQVRWVAVASALALVAAIAVAAAARDRESALLASTAQRIAAGGLLVVVLLVSPLLNARLPLAASDAPQLVVRDLSWWLRRRVGEGRPVVFASPNATLWAAWFGGFRGLGTLYWENVEGLRASTALWVAPTADSVRALARAHDVRFMVFQPSDRGLESLADAAGAGSARGFLPALVEALQSGAGTAATPSWLVPVPYPAPRAVGLGQPSAVILEVIPDAPPEATLLRLAQYYQAAGVPEAMDRALRASLEARPTAGAWGLRARLAATREDLDALAADVRGVRAALATGEPVAPGGRADAAAALALAGDTVGAARQLDLALAAATDADLREMPADALAILVTLSRRLGVDRLHPEPLARAEALLR